MRLLRERSPGQSHAGMEAAVKSSERQQAGGPPLALQLRFIPTPWEGRSNAKVVS